MHRRSDIGKRALACRSGARGITMVYRLYVEKKPGFDNEARALLEDAALLASAYAV